MDVKCIWDWFTFLTSSSPSNKWSTLLYNELMDSQISLVYWANCNGVSIMHWPDLTFWNTRFSCSPNTTHWSLSMTTFIVMPCDILFLLDFVKKWNTDLERNCDVIASLNILVKWNYIDAAYTGFLNKLMKDVNEIGPSKEIIITSNT